LIRIAVGEIGFDRVGNRATGQPGNRATGQPVIALPFSSPRLFAELKAGFAITAIPPA